MMPIIDTENQGTCKRDDTGFHLLRPLCIAAPPPKEGCSQGFPSGTPYFCRQEKLKPTPHPTPVPPNGQPSSEDNPKKNCFFSDPPPHASLGGSKPTLPLPRSPLGRAARANGGGQEVQRPLSHARGDSRVRRSSALLPSLLGGRKIATRGPTLPLSANDIGLLYHDIILFSFQRPISGLRPFPLGAAPVKALKEAAEAIGCAPLQSRGREVLPERDYISSSIKNNLDKTILWLLNAVFWFSAQNASGSS